MLALQVSIGALNDVADEHLDRSEKPRKPLAAGLLDGRSAAIVAGLALGIGLSLSAASGFAALLVAAAGVSLGYAYDLRLSRTAWSWLPLALALPLLPVHAWLGATGEVPPGLLTLAPTAVLAGSALAIANGLVDAERDRRAGRGAIAVRLGPRRAWLVHAFLLVDVALLAAFVAPEVRFGAPELLGILRSWGLGVGVAALGVGAMILRSADPGVRERAWELEAVGIAAVGVGWLAGTAGAMAAAGGLAGGGAG